MSVPIILDKSAFQGLSHRELATMARYFIHCPPPVLISEIVADLTKKSKRAPAEEVARIARKFGGSGGPIQMGHSVLIRASLDEAVVPMTGQAIPHNMSVVPTADGPVGYIGISETNRLILRLARRDIHPEDEQFASDWRESSRKLSLSKLDDYLRRQRVIVPRAASVDLLCGVVDSLLGDATLQDVWFSWILQHEPKARLRDLHQIRWASSSRRLATFAPYAFHCVRTLMLFSLARRNSILTRRQATDLIDLQYLYHSPFCVFFVSNDRVHTTLAPLLMRDYQAFIPLGDFKRSLTEIADHFDALPEKARSEQLSRLGSTPPSLENELVDAWSRVIRAWGTKTATDV